MHTWRKVGCCLFVAVAAAMLSDSALAAVPDELSVRVGVEDFGTCVPVATATFPEGASRVALEWSDAADGSFAELDAVENPVGTSCAFTNFWALVADPRHYRITVTDVSGNASSAPVAFTRFRRLERNPYDEHALALGCSMLKAADDKSITPFDGYTATSPNNGSYALVGVRFLEAVHLAWVRMISANNRCNNQSIYGATDPDDRDATKSELGKTATLTANVWYGLQLSGSENAYRCCWFNPQMGDAYEFQIYGWAEFDVRDSSGAVSVRPVPTEDSTNFYPIVTATFRKGASRVAIQRGRQVDGNYTDLVAVENPTEPTLVFTNTAAKVGQSLYYRVAVTTDAGAYYSSPKKFTRFRQLERDPADKSKLRDGVTMIGNCKNTFDGKTSTETRNISPQGVDFGDGDLFHIAALNFYPREGQGGRLGGRYAVAYADAAARSAGQAVNITPFIACRENIWRWLESTDSENTYRYVQISPQNGDLGEMEVFGWTATDIEATGDPYFPTSLTAVNGENDGDVVLTWGGGKNIDSYSVQYRLKGDADWQTAASGLEPTVESRTVSGLTSGQRYEFRVAATGDGDTGYSPVAEAFVYHLVPGPGTGLMTLYTGPVATRDYTRHLYFEKRQNATLEVEQEGGSLFERTNLTSAVAMYRGQLVVPVTGTYTLAATVKGTDGVTIFVDGERKASGFASAGYKATTLTLEAGNHDFGIDYRSVNEEKSLSVTWALDGVWTAQPIPTSQLLPASDDAFALPDADSTYGGWDFTYPTSGASLLPSLTWLGNGNFRISGASGSYVASQCAHLTRRASGAFKLTADVDSADVSAYPSLYVGATRGINYVFTGTSFGMREASGGQDWGGRVWVACGSGRFRMMVQRFADGHITFSYRKLPDGEWQTYLDIPTGEQNGVSFKAHRMYVGAAGTAGGSMTSKACFSNLTLKVSQGLMVILK